MLIGTSLAIASAMRESGKNLLGRADLDGGLGHAPDDARRLVLGNRPPVQAAELEQSRRAVAPHAGQQGSNAGPGPVLGHAVEEHVDRRPVTDRPGLDGVMQAGGPHP